MDIQTAAHYLKSGYRVTRPGWRNRFRGMRWVDRYRVCGFYWHLEDLLANDWEIDRTDLIDDSGMEPVYKDDFINDEEE